MQIQFRGLTGGVVSGSNRRSKNMKTLQKMPQEIKPVSYTWNETTSGYPGYQGIVRLPNLRSAHMANGDLWIADGKGGFQRCDEQGRKL